MVSLFPIILVGIFLILAVIVVVVLLVSIKKPRPGQALIIIGQDSLQIETTRSRLVIPFIQRFDYIDTTVKTIRLSCQGNEALLSKDKKRLEANLIFYVRVNPMPHDVDKIMSTVGSRAATLPETLNHLFLPKFMDAVTSLVGQTDAESMLTNKEKLKDQLLQMIGYDLNGYVLDDLAIERLTPID